MTAPCAASKSCALSTAVAKFIQEGNRIAGLRFLDAGEFKMFVPPSKKKDRFGDLYARVMLKTEMPSLPPEICTGKTYNRWFAYQIGGLVVLALIGLLYYWLRS